MNKLAKELIKIAKSIEGGSSMRVKHAVQKFFMEHGEETGDSYNDFMKDCNNHPEEVYWEEICDALDPNLTGVPSMETVATEIKRYFDSGEAKKYWMGDDDGMRKASKRIAEIDMGQVEPADFRNPLKIQFEVVQPLDSEEYEFVLDTLLKAERHYGGAYGPGNIEDRMIGGKNVLELYFPKSSLSIYEQYPQIYDEDKGEYVEKRIWNKVAEDIINDYDLENYLKPFKAN